MQRKDSRLVSDCWTCEQKDAEVLLKGLSEGVKQLTGYADHYTNRFATNQKTRELIIGASCYFFDSDTCIKLLIPRVSNQALYLQS